MNSVRIVDRPRPPMIVIASGRCIWSPVPRPSAIGNRPTSVVTVVIRIGRRRRELASMIAARPPRPSARRSRIVATLTMASFTSMPSSAIRPISDMMFSDWPHMASAASAQAMPTGSTAVMMNGSRKLSNCAARSM